MAKRKHGITSSSTEEEREGCADGNKRVKRQRQRQRQDESYDDSNMNEIYNHAAQFQGVMRKYWSQRYNLFSRYDDGVVLTKELWFSVTPENVSKYIARFIQRKLRERYPDVDQFTILDTFCGGGGNVAQFLVEGMQVFAVDINRTHLMCTENNATVYVGAEACKEQLHTMAIDWSVLREKEKQEEKQDDGAVDDDNFASSTESIANIASLQSTHIDAVFGSPPWGGPQYLSASVYDLESGLAPLSLTEQLLEMQRRFGRGVGLCLFLPRNSDMDQLRAATAAAGYDAVHVVRLASGPYHKGVLACWGCLSTNTVSKL